MILTFIIIILILLVPIPIKFKVRYIDNKLDIHIYNIDLTSKIKYSSKKVSIKNKDKQPFTLRSLKLLLSLLNRNSFKPTLRFKLNFEYGLDDAAYTAVFYGLISSLYPLIIMMLKYPFNIKKHSICITPNLNKLILKLELNSIIFVNFAKVIYILYIIYRVWRTNQKLTLTKT
ncbi:DUF2953 domain-containing protein [Clostridium sp. P21]|uniref:DUF2953 domain-containing protein n=1 Tax=Clostridium muellerianum TaxID=2716538 RepID=A0A7Y0ED89_9CLOT|nr:DUF2953 domain-containing protein [Clostridium muellerianum]